ncbi:MAG: AEC family transporter [Clostridia bacterium]|jgi:malate permease and related proteins|nr:AEC family transporter [Clostridia bacterium]MBT7123208.1 AEC family transporter [Clostridia bacterium]
MAEFVHILLNISLPIILLIAVGFGFQKIFKTDVRTFVKLQVYLVIPVMVFIKLYSSQFSADLLYTVVPYMLILMVVLFGISQLLSVIFRFDRPRRKAMGNAFMLINTGNYGIPLIELTFPGNPIAFASQIIMIVVQNIITGTFCVYQASSGKSTSKQALLNIVKMPILYAIVLGILLRTFSVPIPKTFLIPMNYIYQAFVAIALITLGIKLAEVKSLKGIKHVIISTVIKMLLAPVIGFGIVQMLGVTGILAQALIIGISTPTAVTAAIIAKEFDNEADFTAQFVLATTVFCTFTLPFVIYFVPKLLPA